MRFRVPTTCLYKLIKSNENVVQQKVQRITHIFTRPCMIFLGLFEVKNALLSLHVRYGGEPSLLKVISIRSISLDLITL